MYRVPKIVAIVALFCGILACHSETPSSDEREGELGGGDVFPAAQIYFDARQHAVSLETLKSHLESTVGGSYEMTEWNEIPPPIPQLLIQAQQPWVLQIDADPEFVPQQIDEIANDAGDTLSAEEIGRLRRCNAIIQAMGAAGTQSPPRADGQVFVVASTSVDPSREDVRRVLLAVADFVDGLTHDLTEDAWIRSP